MAIPNATGQDNAGQERVLGGEEWGVIAVVLAVVPYQLLIQDNAEKAWLAYLATCAGSAVLLIGAFFMKWRPGRFTAVMLTTLGAVGAALAVMEPGASRSCRGTGASTQMRP
ncbi:hypothetical protein AB0M39_10410 [Streptomyces sp. NPDC051907]|uniref:hypothetical protein n=1 Tax=Streptomyces sp. NPDC051907 TaxID=3155284 RepID=UPI003444BEDB